MVIDYYIGRYGSRNFCRWEITITSEELEGTMMWWAWGGNGDISRPIPGGHPLRECEKGPQHSHGSRGSSVEVAGCMESLSKWPLEKGPQVMPLMGPVGSSMESGPRYQRSPLGWTRRQAREDHAYHLHRNHSKRKIWLNQSISTGAQSGLSSTNQMWTILSQLSLGMEKETLSVS